MALADKLNAMVTSYNAMLGSLLGKLSTKANKTEVYTRSYLDDTANTIGANAASTTKLKNPISVTFTGEATGSLSDFDGSTNVSVAITVPGLADKADSSDVYTKTETDNRIQSVINSAPEALDTLNELAAALGDDPNFSSTVTTELGKKANKADVHTKSEADLTYLGITATADNAAKLGGELPSHYATAASVTQSNTNLETAVDRLKTLFDDAKTTIEAS